MIVYTDNINQDIMLKAIQDKIISNTRIQKLQDYYNGKQEILNRWYDDPTKPNNKIVVNYMKDVADFLTSYLVGVPVQYLKAPKELKTSFKYNDNDETTIQVVTNMNTCGFGAELFYNDETGTPRFNSLDPKECIFFMNDDLEQEITAFIRLIKNDDNIGGYLATYYTSSDYTVYRVDEVTNSLTQVEETTLHYWQDVPVTIYINNTDLQGSFEQAIPMQDALNKIMSDNVNDFESFVDSYLVLEGLQGTTTEDIANMKRDRVLLTDKDSKAYWLTKTVNNTHIKTLQDDIKSYIMQTCNIPDFDNEKFLYAPSGEAMKVRLIKTETQANGQERAVTKGLQRKVELLYNIYNIGKKDSYTKVVPTFTRNYLNIFQPINDVSDAFDYPMETMDLINDTVEEKVKEVLANLGVEYDQ